MAKKAKVINRYRFNADGTIFTFFANSEELLGVEVNHSEELDIPGVKLTKSNAVIDAAISQINDYISGESKKIDLPFAENKTKFNKLVKDSLK